MNITQVPLPKIPRNPAEDLPVNPGAVDYFTLGFKHLLQFKGRSSQAEFWWFFCGMNIIAIMIPIFNLLAPVLLLLPNLAIISRRLHDINYSFSRFLLHFGLLIVIGHTLGMLGFLVSYKFIEIAVISVMLGGVIFFFYYFFQLTKRGTAGLNHFGEDPLQQIKNKEKSV